MEHHIRIVLARILVVGILVSSVNVGTHAAVRTKTYRNTADRYSFSYPAAWQVGSFSRADMSGIPSMAALATSGSVVTPSDGTLVSFQVWVARRATDNAMLRAVVDWILHHPYPVIGSAKDDAATINGVQYLRATGTVSIDAQRIKTVFRESCMGASRGSLTYYLKSIYFTKPKTATSQDKAKLAGVLASFRLT
jgi:hypothetical protein